MITLDKLLDSLQKMGFAIDRQPFDNNSLIYQISNLTESAPLDLHTLYILSTHKLSASLRNRIEEFTEGPLIILDIPRHPSLSFDVITLNEESNATIVWNILNNRLLEENLTQMDIASLYSLVLNGSGIDALTRHAEELLGYPVSICDNSYTIISASPAMHNMPFGLDESSDGLFLSTGEIESLRRLQIEDKIYSTTEAFFVNTPDHPDTNWIFSAIRINRVMNGYVAICLPSNVTATPRQLSVATALARLCSLEMQKHDYFIEQTGLQYETFLSDLLDGRFVDIHRINSRLKLLNRKIGSYFCLALFDRLSPSGSDFFQKRQLFVNSMSIIYRNIIVLLINQDTPINLNEEFLTPFREFAQRNNLRVVLSQPFADLSKTHVFFTQAHTYLKIAEQLPQDKTLSLSCEALPYILFTNTDTSTLESCIHYHLFQLQDYDSVYHTEFIPTLRAYIRMDRNMTKAACMLHIHRSTFFYRIKKIEELLDISITDSHLLFLYEISFMIWDYLLNA